MPVYPGAYTICRPWSTGRWLHPRTTLLRITPSLFTSAVPETDTHYFHPTLVILRTWRRSWTYFSKPFSQHEVLVRVQVRVKMPASKPAGGLQVVTACSWSQTDTLNCLRTPRNPFRWTKILNEVHWSSSCAYFIMHGVMRTYGGGGTALCILELHTGWKWSDSLSNVSPLYTLSKWLGAIHSPHLG